MTPELNPVRSGMVDHPGDYGWSRYRCHAMGRLDPLVTIHSRYIRLGENQRQLACCAMSQNHINEQTLESLRQATNRTWVPGNDRLEADVIKLLVGQGAQEVRGGDRISAASRKQCEINRV